MSKKCWPQWVLLSPVSKQRSDRLIDAQVDDALKGERNASANVLVNDGVVDAAQLGHAATLLGMLHRGYDLAEQHSRRDMVHGQLVSHHALDGDDPLILVDVRHVLDEQLQRQSLLFGLGGGLLGDRGGRAAIIVVVIKVIKVNKHIIGPEEQVGDDDIDDGRQHVECERVGFQVNVPVERVGAVHLAIKVCALLLVGQRAVLGP